MARAQRPPTRQPTEKTTINLPKELKFKAKVYALKTSQDLQDVIAEGLRIVLAQKGAK